MSPAVAAAVAELVRHRTTSALRQAAAEVPPDLMGDFCEFLVLVAFELAKLGSSMTTDVLGLRFELMGGGR